MEINYTAATPVRQIIADDYRLLQALSRLGISLGFGEKTLGEVCSQRGLQVSTCVALLKYISSNGEHHIPAADVDVTMLLAYLRQTHIFYQEYMFPTMRRKLLGVIDCSSDNELAFMMLRFYDSYVAEVTSHMQFEETVTFAYVEAMLNEEPHVSRPETTQLLAYTHDEFDEKLSELKNVFIQYYPQEETNNELNEVLFQIYRSQEDLAMHCMMEDRLFIPAVKRLEQHHWHKKQVEPVSEKPRQQAEESLSVREKDIVICVAKGLSNKEIADKLCLSINTVTTHRRNIVRKLGIHSAAGITIYAIVHKLVTLSEVHM